jgi:two-component system chemotaxis response regulator CheY
VYGLCRCKVSEVMMSVRSATVSDRPGAADNGERGALRLLVVDDDATQRALIAQAAKLSGHVATFAASCSEALAEIQNRRFDCVTVDLMLDDGEGTEVLKALADAKFAGAVIVISGMDASRRIAARSYARSLGIDLQSLPKPVDLAALRICLANLSKVAMGLPVMHIWGGVAADGVAERHRP